MSIKNPRHVMIDLETMSTRPHGAIVSIGAVKFDPRFNMINRKDTFYIELDWEDQGRTIDPDTLEWWGKQSAQARSALDGLDDLGSALVVLSKWLPKDVKVWGNGSTFDISFLENAYEQLGMKIPWQFWNVRDCRTVLDMYECKRGGFNKKVGPGAHNALSDALYQSQYINKMWTSLVGDK